MGITDKLSIHDEILIKEISLVNAIISRYHFDPFWVGDAVKIALNSIKEFSEGPLQKEITLLEEMVDFQAFLSKKIRVKGKA